MARAATSVTAVDRHIAGRLRRRRRELKLSMQMLAAAIGVSYQQIAKYEAATNRIPASRLYLLANALQTPILYFFEGLPSPREYG